jgi:hypothetical protein
MLKHKLTTSSQGEIGISKILNRDTLPVSSFCIAQKVAPNPSRYGIVRLILLARSASVSFRLADAGLFVKDFPVKM